MGESDQPPPEGATTADGPGTAAADAGGPADGVGRVVPVPRQVEPEGDHPGHGRPEEAGLVPRVVRHVHGVAGRRRLLRDRRLRRDPRGLRDLNDGAGLHHRRGRHLPPERLFRDDRLPPGEDVDGDRERARGQHTERVHRPGDPVDHRVVVPRGGPLQPLGEELGAGGPDVRHHPRARGPRVRVLRLLLPPVVGRPVPRHLRHLPRLRPGAGNHELRDLALRLQLKDWAPCEAFSRVLPSAVSEHFLGWSKCLTAVMRHPDTL
mmetsp:Transcript_96142/g.272172  ORF Transcript_96142/g.272172 Transcript_96142/m.272172 type:complete len:264 (-) Transcript_96142:25-816(-)